MHTYAIIFMIVLYSFVIIGGLFSVWYLMRVLSKYTHKYLTMRMLKHRDDHHTMLQHMHINTRIIKDGGK